MAEQKSAFAIMQEAAVATNNNSLTLRQITARVAGIAFALLCLKSIFG